MLMQRIRLGKYLPLISSKENRIYCDIIALLILIGNAIFYCIFVAAMKKFVDVILPLPLPAILPILLPEEWADEGANGVSGSSSIRA